MACNQTLQNKDVTFPNSVYSFTDVIFLYNTCLPSMDDLGLGRCYGKKEKNWEANIWGVCVYCICLIFHLSLQHLTADINSAISKLLQSKSHYAQWSLPLGSHYKMAASDTAKVFRLCIIKAMPFSRKRTMARATVYVWSSANQMITWLHFYSLKNT